LVERRDPGGERGRGRRGRREEPSELGEGEGQRKWSRKL
jgi:hypothetical protein